MTNRQIIVVCFMFASLWGGTVVACLILSAAINDVNSGQKRAQKEIVGIRACVFNSSYKGVTWEDNRQLFLQCIDDYKDSK